jgi:hypothetical protein
MVRFCFPPQNPPDRVFGRHTRDGHGKSVFAAVFVGFTKQSLLPGAFGVVDAGRSLALTLDAFSFVMTSPWVATAKSLPPPQAPNGASPWGWRLTGYYPEPHQRSVQHGSRGELLQ